MLLEVNSSPSLSVDHSMSDSVENDAKPPVRSIVDEVSRLAHQNI